MLTFPKAFETWQSLATASRQYDVPLTWVLRRALRLHNRQLFSISDMLSWGLLDPDIPTSELEFYVSREARTRLQARLNDPYWQNLVNNKARFYAFCQNSGLAIPTILGVIPPAANPEQATHRQDWATTLDQHRGHDLVCKPVLGLQGQGKGVFIARAEANGYRVGDQTLSSDGLYDHLSGVATEPGLMVQLRERAHPVIQQLSGSESLQSARIVTFLDEGGCCRIMFSRFKFIAGNNHIDNFSWGTLGNMTSDVDPDTGIVRAVFTTTPGRPGMTRISRHPDTGNTLVGIKLPLWQEALALACSGAQQLPNVRTLGWDIGITATKPVILETNPGWIVSPPGPMKRPVSRREWQRLMKRA